MRRAFSGYVIDPEPYGPAHKRMLASSHYLALPPPGCLFCVGVRPAGAGLFDVEADGPLVGCCLVGRPVARMLPQDGSVGEIVRLVLADGLPYGMASRVLLRAADIARARRMESLIAYHDRTRHTGCVYRKAGFRRDGTTQPAAGAGWGSRAGRVSAKQERTPKRRWRLTL